MPTPTEVRDRMAAAKAALSACKNALMPKGTEHPVVAETDSDVHGGVVIDRAAYYEAMKLLSTYEASVDHLGGRNAEDVEPAPEVTHAGDEAAINAALEELSA